MTRYEELFYNDIHKISVSLDNLIKKENESTLISRNKRVIDDKSRLILSQEALQIVGKNVIVDVYNDKIIIRKSED